MDLFKDLIWDNVIDAALIELFAAFPFLNFWPINMAVRYIAHELADFIYAGVHMVIDTTAIVIKNETLRREYGHAQVKLKILAGKVDIESEEFKNARTQHRLDLSKYVRIGGAA